MRAMNVTVESGGVRSQIGGERCEKGVAQAAVCPVAAMQVREKSPGQVARSFPQ